MFEFSKSLYRTHTELYSKKIIFLHFFSQSHRMKSYSNIPCGKYLLQQEILSGHLRLFLDRLCTMTGCLFWPFVRETTEERSRRRSVLQIRTSKKALAYALLPPRDVCDTTKVVSCFPARVREKRWRRKCARRRPMHGGRFSVPLGDVTSSLRRCCPRRRPSFISAFPPSNYLIIFFHSTKANQC